MISGTCDNGNYSAIAIDLANLMLLHSFTFSPIRSRYTTPIAKAKV